MAEGWKHDPDCLLADADEVDEMILLANLGPCPCSPAGKPALSALRGVNEEG